MQPSDFLSEAKRALSLRGVLGTRATDLLEEWRDHLETEIEQLVAGGEEPEEAARIACKTLGEPTPLAGLASKQLTQGSWQGRHPWLSAGVIFVVLAILGMFLCASCGGILVKTWEGLSKGTLQNLVSVVSALPWLLGVLWLAWYARRMPAGWKGFWIVAFLVGLALNVLNFAFHPPRNGPGTGTLVFWYGFHPNGNFIKGLITFSFAGFYWWRTTRGGPVGCRVGTINQLAICFACLLSSCATPSQIDAIVQAKDQGRIAGIPPEQYFTLSIPNPIKGKYSKIDSVKLTVGMKDNSQYAGHPVTVYLGKSRKTGQWEVFAAMVKQRASWKMIPVSSDIRGE